MELKWNVWIYYDNKLKHTRSIWFKNMCLARNNYSAVLIALIKISVLNYW